MNTLLSIHHQIFSRTQSAQNNAAMFMLINRDACARYDSFNSLSIKHNQCIMRYIHLRSESEREKNTSKLQLLIFHKVPIYDGINIRPTKRS